MGRSKGTRLAIREARLITAELRRLGVPPKTIAKLWAFVIAVPVILILGYFVIHYDPGTDNPAVLNGVQITRVDQYRSHIHNSTGITLRSLTLICSPGGDSQPITSTTQIGELQPGFGEDSFLPEGECRVVRVNESHQLW